MTNEEEISPSVREVLSRIPKWYESWGTSLIAIVIFSLLAMAWFIRYSDVVAAKVTLTTSVPSPTLYSRTSGLLTYLKAANTPVQAGEYVAVISNSGPTEDIREVQQELKQVQQQLADPIALIQYVPTIHEHLGDVQEVFSLFIQRLTSYQYLLRAPHFQQKAHTIKSQMKVLDEMNVKLLHQKKLLEDELELFEAKYHRDSALVANGAMTPADFEKTHRELVRKRKLLMNVLTKLNQNRLQKTKLTGTLMSGHESYNRNQQTAYVLLQESMQKLRSSITDWEKMYVLKAPIKGQLVYVKNWINGQYVPEGELLFSVIPPTKEVIGQAELPIANSGKVKIGQTVRIRLNPYPYQQYGSLTGEVASISLVPSGESYQLSIRLPRSLRTNYNKSIEFKQPMQGTAHIITEELSLLERIFFQLGYPFTKAI
jgi:HlyD family secretion protein